MNEYILTYWWFGSAAELPPGLTGSPPPGVVSKRSLLRGVAGGRTGIAQVAAQDVPTAVRQFQDAVGDTGRTGDFLVLSVVEFPGLTIADRGLFVEGQQISKSIIDDIDPSGSGAELHAHATRPSSLTPRGPEGEWIVTGTIAGDDQRFVQRVNAGDVYEAVRKVVRWLADVHNVDAATAEIWSVALRGPGARLRVYQGTSDHRGPGNVSTTAASWLRGEFEELPFYGAAGRTPQPPGPKLSPADLEAINQHRSSMGMGPIDLGAGWTTKELKEMAESIRATGRMHNAGPYEKLKRRLMHG